MPDMTLAQIADRLEKIDVFDVYSGIEIYNWLKEQEC